MMTPKQRWLILGGGLALTVALGEWLSPPNASDVAEATAPVVRKPGSERAKESKSSKGSNSEPVRLAALDELRAGQGQAAAGEEVKEIFGAQTWIVAPPPGAAPPPEPPPLPFTYLGKLKENGVMRVFLATKDRNLVASAGDVIDGTYRVEEIASSAMTFRYLPLDKQQTLEIGRAP